MKFNLENIKKLQKKGEKLHKKQEEKEIKSLISMLKNRIRLDALNNKTSVLHFYGYNEQEIVKTVSKYFTDLGFTTQIEEGEYKVTNILVISWDFD